MAESLAVRSRFYLSVTCSSSFHSAAFSLQPPHLACTLPSSASLRLFVYVYMYGSSQPTTLLSPASRKSAPLQLGKRRFEHFG